MVLTDKSPEDAHLVKNVFGRVKLSADGSKVAGKRLVLNILN
jgi:hypothetical protein